MNRHVRVGLVALAMLGCGDPVSTRQVSVDEELQFEVGMLNRALVRAYERGARVDLLAWTSSDSTQAPVLIVLVR